MRTHRCPGCRKVDVPNTLLACLPCWRKLPASLQVAVRLTARLPVLAPRRREVLAETRRVWEEAS